MLGRFLAAIGAYVLIAAVFCLCILWMMRDDPDMGLLSRLWPLALASIVYVVAFVKIGCKEEQGH